MDGIKEIINHIVAFRDERNWEQFHNAKDLAVALSIEASELNELFLWKSPAETGNIERKFVADELADVLMYALLLADRFKFDVKEIILDKIKKNALKYPVEKSKNLALKYTQL
ncbi:MAG TPA: nucleotide pyrophosphohydrolase [Bacteroidales bacterium]|nr:MAG: MazG-like family protein [Bacteroidetes bacterium ADurb.Bin041]HNV50918.1 nucleotide pyrophosphohydrolase [Bacteroidales bacterium]HPW43959.1 nucleotide pyrophosphohydrolase [Bacteroidales bacterium]HQF02262.1 nucleotide pyrophosphohydrolase [Bacteroidales bacterium]HQH15406.1 nucleotide pyrophosphohydrolase [Bacteroidales bacterium]